MLINRGTLKRTSVSNYNLSIEIFNTDNKNKFYTKFYFIESIVINWKALQEIWKIYLRSFNY